MAAYSASKAALTAFDRVARLEARRRDIRVIDIRPPHTETGLAGRPIAGSAPKLPPRTGPGRLSRAGSSTRWPATRSTCRRTRFAAAGRAEHRG